MRTSTKIAVVLLLTTMAASVAHATSEIVRDPKSWDFAPLLYSDRIVRGTVVSKSRIEILSSDLWMDPPERRMGEFKTPVLQTVVCVHEVLRGPITPLEENDTLLVWDEPVRVVLPIGVEVVLCESFHSGLKTYYQAGSYGRYVRKEKSWASERTARGQRTFTDEEIRTKIASMDIDHVASEAELIVEGTIDSVAESDYFGPDSSIAGMVTLTFKVVSVEKGQFSDDVIVMKALMNGMYLPEWRKHVPQSYSVGQHWLCFLKKNEVGWHPFAGTNGLLRIEGDGYIYDERVPFWYSREQVAKAMSASRESLARLDAARPFAYSVRHIVLKPDRLKRLLYPPAGRRSLRGGHSPQGGTP